MIFSNFNIASLQFSILLSNPLLINDRLERSNDDGYRISVNDIYSILNEYSGTSC